MALEGYEATFDVRACAGCGSLSFARYETHFPVATPAPASTTVGGFDVSLPAPSAHEWTPDVPTQHA
ncbi:MAG: hypothetical protein ACYDDF_06720 [Thermoplasmatota archaeon]